MLVSTVNLFMFMWFSFLFGWLCPLMMDLYRLQKEEQKIRLLRDKAQKINQQLGGSNE